MKITLKNCKLSGGLVNIKEENICIIVLGSPAMSARPIPRTVATRMSR